MNQTHRNYLRDLGHLVRERAVQAHSERRSGDNADAAFSQGYSLAWYEVASLMRDQAVAFQLPEGDLAFDGFNPEALL